MKLKLVLLVSALSMAVAANAVNLAVWNFNDSTQATRTSANTASLFSVDSTANAVTATMTSNFTETTAAGINAFTGTTVGAVAGTLAGNELALEGGTASGTPATYVNNGKYLQISLSLATTKITLDKLTYATRRSGSGFNSQAWSYSLNGTDFTALSTNSTYNGTSAALAVTTVDLSSVPKSNDIFLRMTLTGASSTTGNNRFDNIVVQGVPEPASMVALGLGAAAMIRRRRKA